MQLCGQYGHPALAVKVNQSVDYFSPTDSWVICGTVHSSVTQTFDCVTGDAVDKRGNHEIAKEGTFSRIKTYDSFNFYRFFILLGNKSTMCGFFKEKLVFWQTFRLPLT